VNKKASYDILPNPFPSRVYLLHDPGLWCGMTSEMLKPGQRLGTAAMSMPHQREVVIEVPRDLLQSKQSHLTNDILREKIIAIDLARRAALSTFPTVAERAVELYDEDLPTWRKNRFHVMNQRPCDHEENGTRAWRLDLPPLAKKAIDLEGRLMKDGVRKAPDYADAMQLKTD
jgi:hypothetical protein